MPNQSMPTSSSRFCLPGALALAALAVALASGIASARGAAREPAGLWLLPRKDLGNTAHADVPGAFRSAPTEVWSYGSERQGYSFARPVTVGGRPAFLLQVGNGLRVVRPDGMVVWQRPALGVGSVLDAFPLAGASDGAVLATLGGAGYLLLDAATGKDLWTWMAPRGTMLAGFGLWKHDGHARLVSFPQDAVGALEPAKACGGFCFELTNASAPPRLLWHRVYEGKYWPNFGPFLVLADMDNDGTPDILLAGKPSYMAVLNLDTGEVKFDLHYPIPDSDHIGRPYGLLQAVDLDGDGYQDAVMISCQVEKYIAILHNERGKGFRLVWSKYIGNDLPDEFKELHPEVTSFADLRGDGQREFVVSLYNAEGDQRWHTLVFDPMGGWQARLADLPDRYFRGCYDLRGDGHPVIITTTEKTRRLSPLSPIQAVDGRTFRDLATLEGCTLSTSAGPLPDGLGFHANRNTPIDVVERDGTRGLLVVRTAAGGKEQLWHLSGDRSVFTRFNATALSRTVRLCSVSPRMDSRSLTLRGYDRPTGPAASMPLVSCAEGARELVLALSDGTLIGGTPDWAHPGRFARSWRVRGTNPAIWLGPGGERVVCALDPDSDAILLQRPSTARKRQPPPVVARPPVPLFRTADRTAGALVPFGDPLRVFVGLRTGIHTLASALYDAEGKQLWFEPNEGPYPRMPAMADFGGDGHYTFIVDNHGKILLYDEHGHSRTVAVGWNNTIPGRGNGAKYALPLVGPFGPGGVPRIVLSPGLEQLELLDQTGARVAMTPYGSIYEREGCGSAVGHLRDAAHWDVGMITGEGVFWCADAATAQPRWSLDLGVRLSSAVHLACGDLDGSGRDAFVLGLANGELVAVGEQGGQGRVLWRKPLENVVTDVILADVDGEGRAELIVTTDDGRVRVLRPSR